MTDDELAAVVAAARVMAARAAADPVPQPPPRSAWLTAARVQRAGRAALHGIAPATSRWVLNGRLRD